MVYDDYAHHPDEIERHAENGQKHGLRPGDLRVPAPHLHPHPISLLEEFANALSYADIAVLTEIYAARETNVNHISTKMLVDKIPRRRVSPPPFD